MPAEWPIETPPRGERTASAATALPAAGERRLAGIVQDFFLAPDVRLTEQERSLMTGMLHGLIEGIAVELRARLAPEDAEACAASSTELIADLTRAGLLQDQALVGLLLRRADVHRLAATGRGGRTTLQRWTAHADGKLAAAAMALVTARGRARGPFGGAGIELTDLPEPLAQGLVIALAAALAERCTRPSDSQVVTAAAALLRDHPEGARVEALEAALADELGEDGRREPGLLVGLAEEGEAALLAAILAAEAAIPADEAWIALLGGARPIALLLRLANVPRTEAAALLAAAGAGLGVGDPIKAIEAFDSLDDAAVDRIRTEMRLPGAYRRARQVLRAHG